MDLKDVRIIEAFQTFLVNMCPEDIKKDYDEDCLVYKIGDRLLLFNTFEAKKSNYVFLENNISNGNFNTKEYDINPDVFLSVVSDDLINSFENFKNIEVAKSVIFKILKTYDISNIKEAYPNFKDNNYIYDAFDCETKASYQCIELSKERIDLLALV
ncbi:hypothetical protein [Streptococcus parauberis]|uniref:hypothetical protein n=1 Tax=Streptococcus parauberis TaxID=1348 RepID=UPI00020CBF4B|nr:hypothetical protein [Streptococcus parauberis]AEF25319.1 hypothetical protein STP_0871 [Streptococcus parauberis KCTC 11537]QBX17950.1 hypothetical protein Javan385_0047 [Streptococcus phage Javan385]UWM91892.1 hypothetical protein N2A94_04465 [Streptococcus parauberis]